MIPAACQNCGGTESHGRQGSPNLAVILGVLGGMALTAVLVFVCVPLVRRRTQASRWASSDVERQHGVGIGFVGAGGGGGLSRRRSSVMSYVARWRRFGNLGSRRTASSYRPVTEGEDLHRHHQKRTVDGQGEKDTEGGALLPLLPEVSTFTWSDLRSKNTSADSSLGGGDGDEERAVQSTPTDAATLSHTTSRRLLWASNSRSHPKPGPGQLGTSSASLDRTASSQQSAGINTQAQRDPQTQPPPRLLSSKAPSATTDSYPDYLKPRCPSCTPDGDTAHDAALPLPPHVSLLLGVDMDPLKPSHYTHHPKTSGSMSRPGSLQLPSPPASPPQLAPPSATSSSRSHVPEPSHARRLSISGPNARPPLPATRSAPATGLLRPPPAPTYTTTPAWWSTTVVHHPSTLSPPQSPPRQHSHSPSVAPSSARSPPPVSSTSRSPAPVSTSSQSPSPQPPLTQAFRSPLQRSASHSSEAAEHNGADGLGRYPSLTMAPEERSESRSRNRSASVIVDRHSIVGERPSRTPQGARPKPGPVEMLLKSGSSSTTPTPGHESDRERKAYYRSSMSVVPQTPKIVDEKSSSSRREKGQSVAMGYFDSRPPLGHGGASTPKAEVGGPSSTTANASASSSHSMHAVDYLSSSHHNTSSSSHPPSSSISRRHSTAHPPPLTSQPNLVRRRDSPALRPLPASTLFYPTSPPTSPPLRPHNSHSREGSLSRRRADMYAGSSRSRSGSVISLATLPERATGRERHEDEGRSAGGSHHDRPGDGLRRRESVSSRRSMLPSVDRLPPMEFAEFEDEGR